MRPTQQPKAGILLEYKERWVLFRRSHLPKELTAKRGRTFPGCEARMVSTKLIAGEPAPLMATTLTPPSLLLSLSLFYLFLSLVLIHVSIFLFLSMFIRALILNQSKRKYEKDCKWHIKIPRQEEGRVTFQQCQDAGPFSRILFLTNWLY